MNPTPNQIKRVRDDYSEMVKEPVRVEFIAGTMYVFGSELACLRLYHRMKTGTVAFSTNLNTWYYAKEVR